MLIIPDLVSHGILINFSIALKSLVHNGDFNFEKPALKIVSKLQKDINIVAHKSSINIDEKDNIKIDDRCVSSEETM